MSHIDIIPTQEALDAIALMTALETETESHCSDMISVWYACDGFDAREICPDDSAARLGPEAGRVAWLLSHFTRASDDEPLKIGDLVHFWGRSIGIMKDHEGTITHLVQGIGHHETTWDFVKRFAGTVRMYHNV